MLDIPAAACCCRSLGSLLISFLLVLLSILEGTTCHCGAHFLCLLMMAFRMFLGTSNALKILGGHYVTQRWFCHDEHSHICIVTLSRVLKVRAAHRAGMDKPITCVSYSFFFFSYYFKVDWLTGKLCKSTMLGV